MSDVLKTAFVGFRHMHLFDVYALMAECRDLQIVAACEEDPRTRQGLQAAGEVRITHAVFEEMLSSVDFDLLVVGDVFARRGARIAAGLRAGKHVLSDKPICTDAGQLTRIGELSERHSLVVGAVLDLRDCGAFRSTRELVTAGAIGPVHTVCFSGQHPLLLSARPDWYFEEGSHGGTINDLAIHAVDILTWITGSGFREVVSARCWNAGLNAHPRFRNAAQVMLVMDGGCGVIGDVSYVSPDGFRYSLPQYWRFNFWGQGGMIETALNVPKVRLYRRDAAECEEIEPEADRPGGYLEELLQAIRGDRDRPNGALFAATDVCLTAQSAADDGGCRLSLRQ